MQPPINYSGDELELFQYAINWKRYFSSFFQPYIQGAVAEVGAGIGANVPFLINTSVISYCCIEPDKRLAEVIATKVVSGELPPNTKVEQGFLTDTSENTFDTILYVDVLEHIENDSSEIKKAAGALKPGGYLCVLVPANPQNYTAFDKSVGHFRRYNKQNLEEIIPSSLSIQWCRHLDMLGNMASKVNKLFLKQSKPTRKQILMWDKFMVPVSKIIDGPTGFRQGKSLLLVAKKLASDL